MQKSDSLSALVHSALTMIVDADISKRIQVSLSLFLSIILLSNIQIPDAYAHVSHVLSTHQYDTIKSGYPDIEIIAAGMTTLMVFTAIFTQLLQKHRQRLETC